MASQGERVLGVVEMDVGLLESMVQDGDPEQDIGVQEQFFPQTDVEPEMGAAAAAEYGTLPPHLRQIPSPTPSETATDNGGSVQLHHGTNDGNDHPSDERGDAANGKRNEKRNKRNEQQNGSKHKRNEGRNEGNAGGDAEHGCGPAG